MQPGIPETISIRIQSSCFSGPGTHLEAEPSDLRAYEHEAPSLYIYEYMDDGKDAPMGWMPLSLEALKGGGLPAPSSLVMGPNPSETPHRRALPED